MVSLLGNPTDVLVRADQMPMTVGDIDSSLKLLLVYVSKHDCPPCREFTPMLAELYREMNESGMVFEVVFVSGDATTEAYTEYLGEMPWPALPHKDPRIKAIAKRFQVKGVPRLIALNAKTAEVIHESAVAIVKE